MPDPDVQGADLKSLRSTMRGRRRDLDAARLAAASAAVARRLWRLRWLARATRIGAYMAINGEIDCSVFMRAAAARGRALYLPILHGNRLLFAPFSSDAALVANRFGIPEPATRPRLWLSAMELDALLVPAVAFDARGHRLGMGGGYYDRSLAFLCRRPHWPRPWVIGLAHEFQRVEFLASHRRDVPLHAAVTELHTYTFIDGSRDGGTGSSMNRDDRST